MNKRLSRPWRSVGSLLLWRRLSDIYRLMSTSLPREATERLNEEQGRQLTAELEQGLRRFEAGVGLISLERRCSGSVRSRQRPSHERHPRSPDRIHRYCAWFLQAITAASRPRRSVARP